MLASFLGNVLQNTHKHTIAHLLTIMDIEDWFMFQLEYKHVSFDMDSCLHCLN